MLSIETTNKNYLLSAKNLTNEILKNTKHDVLISTNNTDYFNELNTDRCLVRNNIQSSSIFKYGGEFNYNLKHHSFINIPEKYDYIVYLDCDIKLTKWDEKSDEFFINKMVNYNYAADRLNCVLKNEVQEYIDGKSPLFTHKIKSYNIIEKYELDNDIMESKLPSEHIFILKNDPEKIILFQKKWSEMNNELQICENFNGSWGDGFEIGISANYAGYKQHFDLGPQYWKIIMGFEFNGNKF
jgi:hypothetical protein